jgi:hypothetical protein
MKNFLIFSFCIFITASFSAQSSFAPLGAKWTYATSLIVPPGARGPFTITVEAIEEFHGKLCSRIHIPFDSAGPWIADSMFVYEQNDSVFFWSPYSNKFQLLYDFTAEVGDSWTIGGLRVTEPAIYGDTLKVTIDSIGSLVLNGDTLKVMHFCCTPNFDWGKSIIEGIGNNFYMIPSFGLYEIGIGELRCYSDDDQDYHFLGIPCDTVYTGILGTSQIDKENSISITPNPVSNSLHLSVPSEYFNCVISIYNMQGQLILTHSQDIPGDCDVSGLSAGMYIFEVRQKGYRSVVKMFVKM